MFHEYDDTDSRAYRAGQTAMDEETARCSAEETPDPEWDGSTVDAWEPYW